jgi:hypothetical protein
MAPSLSPPADRSGTRVRAQRRPRLARLTGFPVARLTGFPVAHLTGFRLRALAACRIAGLPARAWLHKPARSGYDAVETVT